MDNSTHYIQWFRQASPYIHKHRGKIAVIMLPGEFARGACLSNIISDISLLTSLGMKIVVVHGARPQIEDALAAKQIDSSFVDGVRVTPREHMAEVSSAIGASRIAIEAGFSCGLPNTIMHGAKLSVRGGNYVYAKPRGVIDGVDFQFTGSVRSVDVEGILSMLYSHYIVLVSPLGYSLTGEVFNLSFADVAVAVATGIEADKLIAYNDQGQIVDVNDRAHREMTLLQCKRFLVETQRHNKENKYYSLQACQQACDGGVPRAHIVNAKEDGALLKELFTRDGSGTMIYRDSYETIRRASNNDIPGVINLIQPLEESGVLVKRSRELLETEIEHFTVMEKDNMVVGCAALYPSSDQGLLELACVAIHPDYQGKGRAKKLIRHIERQAARVSAHTLFLLTTQTSHWFIELGFIEGFMEALPVEKQALYNFQRNSKVFTKRVSVHPTTVDL